MKVLLPTDGSDCSKKTLEWAASIFNKDTAKFYLFTVVPHVVPELSTMTYEVEDALEVLKESETYLKDKGFTVEKSEYVLGDPAEKICEFADEIGADQIVIGSHGRSGISKLLLGSVSSSVFERSSVPVLVHKNKVERKAKI